MIPPTSIDGTDITGATIDGTDVQEITVDGDVVFGSAAPSNLPVAYSNLVAWYPFDSAEYGGSNADDVTALFNPSQSGDSTAYDGTVESASYQSSGGVTDINAGANSGGFDFSGNEGIETSGTQIGSSVGTFSYGGWIFPTTTTQVQSTALSFGDEGSPPRTFIQYRGDDQDISLYAQWGSISKIDIRINGPANNWYHTMFVKDGSNARLYVDGAFDDTYSITAGGVTGGDSLYIGRSEDSDHHFDGRIDDVRVYDKALSTSEVSQIYNNTKP